jgi:hypothetical protein
VRRIGVLMGYAESDPDAQANVAAFRESLQKLGWAEGRNVRIDTRWPIPADVESMQRFAKELVALPGRDSAGGALASVRHNLQYNGSLCSSTAERRHRGEELIE